MIQYNVLQYYICKVCSVVGSRGIVTGLTLFICPANVLVKLPPMLQDDYGLRMAQEESSQGVKS